MVQTRLLVFALGAVTAGSATAASAEVFGGVEFPYGTASFADEVVSFSPGSDSFSPHNDPSAALGVPDYSGTGTYTALGQSGVLVVEFTDNLLVDQTAVEDGNDLYIFEIGPAVEGFTVEISTDGNDYINVGTVSGQPTAIDIGPFVEPEQSFRFVRLTDDGDGSSGSPTGGADIDAIGAIGSTAIPEPAGLVLATPSLLALRRRR